jgi:arylsulfatase A-like enzyme
MSQELNGMLPVTHASPRNERGLLKLFLLLSFASTLPFVALALLKYRLFFSGDIKVSVHWTEILTDRGIVLPFVWYLIAFIGTYLAFAAVLWALYLPLARRSTGERRVVVARAIVLFLVADMWLLLLHARVFPNGSFVSIGEAAGPGWVGEGLVWTFSVLLGALATVSLTLGMRRLWRQPAGWRATAGLGTLAAATLVTLGVLNSSRSPAEAKGVVAAARAPDVIIIGMDSLRPDYVPTLGFPRDIMPNLARFLSGAAVFQDTLTPLARTFPSWVSVLTGLKPIHNGARFNLEAPGLVKSEHSIAHAFQRLGYQTAYATDETRFSNIDQRYGFDRVLSPPMGAPDFLLGSTFNSPATDLLVATPLGPFLFPYNTMNRGAYTTYLPKEFDTKVARFLAETDDRPLFLSIHFCLPHWPYQWAAMPATTDASLPAPFQDSDPNYLAALQRVDGQVGSLLQGLERNGRLKNAIVVVLSDHGESFLLAKDHLSPGGKTTTPVATDLIGHGTDVLNLGQYRVLLAFRAFGDPAVTPGIRRARASLTDIAPTLADLLIPGSQQRFDGHSLRPLLRGTTAAAVAQQRPLFLESGFSIPAILTLNPSAQEIFHQGARYYDIHRSGRLTIRRDTRSELLRNKQRAVLLGDWLLAVMPSEGEAPTAVLVDLKTKRWWTQDNWQDSKGPINAIAGMLCDEYGMDPGFDAGGLCTVN